MTDDFDVLTRLRDYHDHIAAPKVSVADDVRRGRRRVARRRALAVGGVALATAGLVLTASLLTDSDPDSLPQPAPSPTEGRTPTEKHTASGTVLRNGRITSAERYLAAEASGYNWRAFDPVSATGLFVTRTSEDGVTDLQVVGRTGTVATLTCGRDVPCSPDDTWLSYEATLGPGADEVTVESGDRTAQVVGYDGTLRRTLDLGAAITGDWQLGGLRWSPDGSRLAVATYQDRPGDALVSRLWLVDRQGKDPRLAYSLFIDQTEPIRRPASEFDGTGTIWPASGWGWSPDGQSLLLDVRTRGSYGADVVLLDVPPDGTNDPVVARTLYHSNRSFDWAGNVAWSPDGTRVAVRTMVPATTTGRHRITEIAAEDGRVLAQHPHDPGWLIWPARAEATRPDTALRTMPEWDASDEGVAVPVDAGRYLVPRSPWSVADFTVTFPPGWTAQYGHVYAKNGDQPDELGFYAVVVDQIYTDSCSPEDETTKAVGPAVDDLYAALRDQAGGAAVSKPVRTTLGGYPATRIDLEIPKGLELARCRMAPAGLQIWYSAPADKYFVLLHDATASVYVVDVDGRRQVFLTQVGDRASAADRAELQTVLDSIRIR